MKKLIAMLLVLVMVFGLCACGADSKKDDDKTDGTTAPSTQATEPSDEATEPSDEVTEPSDEVTEPNDETTEPTGAVPDYRFYYKGLELWLPSTVISGEENENGLYFTCGNVEYFVGVDSLENLGADAADSEALALWVGEQFQEDYEVTVDMVDGVGFVIAETDEGDMMVGGCYIYGDTVWGVNAAGKFDDVDAIVAVVTAGVIDESYVPEDSTDPTVPSEPEIVDPGIGDPVGVMFSGLEITLDNLFTSDYADETMTCYSNGKIYVEIDFEPLSSWDNVFSDPEGYAAIFAEAFEMDVSQIQTKNATPYLVVELPDFEEFAVYGFYVLGEVCWRVVAMSPDEADVERMVDMVTSGVIYMNQIPEIKEQELPEPSEDMTFAGLTVHLDGVGVPTMVVDQYMTFNYADHNYDIVVDSAANMGVELANSQALAEYLKSQYEFMWGSASVEVLNGTSYMLCRDDDGFALVVGCYVDGETIWTVTCMEYIEDLDVVIDVVTSGEITEG